ncbi:MAG: helix-hairpin-helix domain-containing protein [Tahibacter sp.]
MNKLIQTLILALAFAFPTFAAQPVNVNTADATAIAASLKGVGQSKAEAIVAYREKNGAFKSADELTKVKGIGEKTIEHNRDMILVDGAVKAKPAAASKSAE